MNKPTENLLYSVSRILRLTEFLISWLSCKIEYYLLRASLRLERYVLNSRRSRSNVTKSSKTASTNASHSQPIQRPRDL